MHLADAFIQSDLDNSGYTFFVSMCDPWESNPQPFALLTQCSTTEPQEINIIFKMCVFCMGECNLHCNVKMSGFVKLFTTDLILFIN